MPNGYQSKSTFTTEKFKEKKVSITELAHACTRTYVAKRKARDRKFIHYFLMPCGPWMCGLFVLRSLYIEDIERHGISLY